MAMSQRERDRRWIENNREHKNYLSRRSNARGFIRSMATLEDVQELRELLNQREYELSLETQKK